MECDGAMCRSTVWRTRRWEASLTSARRGQGASSGGKWAVCMLCSVECSVLVNCSMLEVSWSSFQKFGPEESDDEQEVISHAPSRRSFLSPPTSPIQEGRHIPPAGAGKQGKLHRTLRISSPIPFSQQKDQYSPSHARRRTDSHILSSSSPLSRHVGCRDGERHCARAYQWQWHCCAKEGRVSRSSEEIV